VIDVDVGIEAVDGLCVHLVCNGRLQRHEYRITVAVPAPAQVHGVEPRLWRPVLQHADDAVVVVVDPQDFSDAVGTPEQLVIEEARDHGDPCTVVVVLRAPATAVLEGCVEHTEEIRGGDNTVAEKRMLSNFLRRNLVCCQRHHSLSLALVRVQQVHRIGVGHQIAPSAEQPVGRRRAVCSQRIDFRREDSRALLWQRIAR
jgi:hypothetical protein